jgi:hypothetical protein
MGAWFVWKFNHRSGWLGFKGIPAMSFADLQKASPFVARIESKNQGVWKPLTSGATGKPIPGAQPTEYVMIYVKTDEGKRLCIYDEGPTSNALAFVSRLHIGQKYSFPIALQQ